MLAEKVRYHLYISGRVQGVGFRAFMLREAQKLGIKGWVKNLIDGRVEAVITGDRHKVKEMLKLAQKGPGWARVDNIEKKKEDYQGQYTGFHIR